MSNTKQSKIVHVRLVGKLLLEMPARLNGACVGESLVLATVATLSAGRVVAIHLVRPVVPRSAVVFVVVVVVAIAIRDDEPELNEHENDQHATIVCLFGLLSAAPIVE